MGFCDPGEDGEGAEKVVVVVKWGIREVRKVRGWVLHGIKLPEILKALFITTKTRTICGDGC